MNAIIKYNLDKKIYSNKKEYFFTFLNCRYELMNSKLIALLQKRYKKKKFEPIYILSAEPGKYHQKSNYIIINKELKRLQQKTKNKKIVLLQDLEDLNIEFSESKFVQALIDKLSKKQDKIFLISFTSFGLKVNNKKIINIGPRAELVEKYDSKIEQIKLFKKLKLPINETRIYSNIDKLKKAKLTYPGFISPTYTSGGAESAILFSNKDLKVFFSKLRRVNKDKGFFVAKYVKDVQSSPNSVGIVCKKNDVRVLCLTDQIIRGIKHTGNIYPTSANKSNQKKMITITKKIGNHLSALGFRGMYGCDFIIDNKGKLSVVELNPRRQSCYLILQLMSKKINLLDVELKLALGESIPKFKYNDIQVKYSWLHNKLKPYLKYQVLKKEFRINNEDSPFSKNGKNFICSYFPKDYVLSNCNFFGYYIASGENYNTLLKKSKEEIENILLNSLKDA